MRTIMAPAPPLSTRYEALTARSAGCRAAVSPVPAESGVAGGDGDLAGFGPWVGAAVALGLGGSAGGAGFGPRLRPNPAAAAGTSVAAKTPTNRCAVRRRRTVERTWAEPAPPRRCGE